VTIVAHLDLRTSHGVARDQGSRPTCLAFALSDLGGQAHALPGEFSPEHLYREVAYKTPGWAPGAGLEIGPAIKVAQSPGHAFEADFPYQAIEPTHPVEPNAPSSAHRITTLMTRVADIGDLMQQLKQGSSVGLVIRLTPEFLQVNKWGAVVPFSTAALANGMSHAVLVVGYGTCSVSNELHFLIRNSWGPSWGDGGHAWVSSQYVSHHAICSFGH
jgi:hypothetical protein